MIQPHELRLGNYVNYEQTTHIISELGKGLAAHYWHKETVDDEYVSRYEELKPIELTPEILEKCGFERFETEDIYDGFRHGEFILERYHFTDETKWFIVGFLGWQCEVEIQYLHQLQNYYYCTIKEELLINNL